MTRAKKRVRASFPVLLPADYEQIASYLRSEASRLRSLGVGEDGPRIYATLFDSLARWMREATGEVTMSYVPAPTKRERRKR